MKNSFEEKIVSAKELSDFAEKAVDGEIDIEKLDEAIKSAEKIGFPLKSRAEIKKIFAEKSSGTHFGKRTFIILCAAVVMLVSVVSLGAAMTDKRGTMRDLYKNEYLNYEYKNMDLFIRPDGILSSSGSGNTENGYIESPSFDGAIMKITPFVEMNDINGEKCDYYEYTTYFLQYEMNGTTENYTEDESKAIMTDYIVKIAEKFNITENNGYSVYFEDGVFQYYATLYLFEHESGFSRYNILVERAFIDNEFKKYIDTGKITVSDSTKTPEAVYSTNTYLTDSDFEVDGDFNINRSVTVNEIAYGLSKIDFGFIVFIDGLPQKTDGESFIKIENCSVNQTLFTPITVSGFRGINKKAGDTVTVTVPFFNYINCDLSDINGFNLSSEKYGFSSSSGKETELKSDIESETLNPLYAVCISDTSEIEYDADRCNNNSYIGIEYDGNILSGEVPAEIITLKLKAYGREGVKYRTTVFVGNEPIKFDGYDYIEYTLSATEVCEAEFTVDLTGKSGEFIYVVSVPYENINKNYVYDRCLCDKALIK